MDLNKFGSATNNGNSCFNKSEYVWAGYGGIGGQVTTNDITKQQQTKYTDTTSCKIPTATGSYTSIIIKPLVYNTKTSTVIDKAN